MAEKLPRVTLVSTSDGWDGLYVDGHLVASGDSMSIPAFVGGLIRAGIHLNIEFFSGHANDDLDADIQDCGSMPPNLPSDWHDK